MELAEVGELSLTKWMDRESDATLTSTQGGVSFSRDYDSNNSVGRERTSPLTPLDSAKPGTDSAMYISIIEKLRAKVSALQNALLIAGDGVLHTAHAGEELLPNEGHATRQLRGEWSRAIETNSAMESVENISEMFTTNTFGEWSKMNFVLPGPMETHIIEPEGTKQHVISNPKRLSREDQQLHVEPVIFVDISCSATRADPPAPAPAPAPYPLCDCATRSFLAQADVRHLRADLSELRLKLDAALSESETLRRERDEAIERGAGEARRKDSECAAAWDEARRLELQLTQWSEKERELQRLRVLMRFSELKKDSDMLGTAAAHLDQMEQERARLLEDLLGSRAQLAECRQQLREAQAAADSRSAECPQSPSVSPRRVGSSTRKTRHQKAKRAPTQPFRAVQETEDKRMFTADQPRMRSTFAHWKSGTFHFNMTDDSAMRKKHRSKTRKT